MDIKAKIAILPNNPGVYRFLDSSGKVIYIGKAKNLRKRVAQYFVSSNQLTAKTRVLVSKIADVLHTVVESEQDALLLENNLIKEFQPKYNILLKDGKSYPWICIKNEPFPRIFLTRKFVKDGSFYFGPYSSVQHAHHLLDLINSLYKIRTCKLSLNKTAIEGGKFKPCLNMHIRKCFAPCIGNFSEQEYNNQITSIKEILKGNTYSLLKEYKLKMMSHSKRLEFEQAQEYKEKIEILNNHYSKSLIVQPNINNTDVFSLVFDGNNAFGNFMRLNQGCIIQSINQHFKLSLETEKESVLTHFMQEIYSLLQGQDPNYKVEEVLVPYLPDDLSVSKNIHIPLRGDKLNLLELSIKNANAHRFNRMKQEEIKNPEEAQNRAIVALKNFLGMESLPVHIECFDNSNTMGTNPVAACVVFKNGKPSKRDYRHFNIKSVVGANDYASMYEIVHRRYSRLLEEAQELPQLVLIDGGKGQLNFAFQALTSLNLHNKIKLISIAERMEEIFTTTDSTPFYLDKNSPALKLLMHLRDEAHRFGITHHRQKRTKTQITSKLLNIKGIGEASQQKLLQHFKSVKRIKEAPIEELEMVVGKKIASIILQNLSNL